MKTNTPRIIVRNLIQKYQMLQQEAFEASLRSQHAAEAKYKEANQLLQQIGQPSVQYRQITTA